MKNDKLERVLKDLDLNKCKLIIDKHIFYAKKMLKHRVVVDDETYRYDKEEYEFLIITNGNEKKGIILKCGTTDSHWFVLKKWRNQGVLSNAL